MRKILLALLAAAAIVPAAPVHAQAQTQPFRLLFIGALSGPVGAVGKGIMLPGYRAAVDDINARGGILGRRVELLTEDSAGQGTRAASILQEKLNSGQRPDAVISGASSNETLGLLPLLSQNKIISVTVSASTLSNNPSQYPYAFMATLNYPYFSNFIGAYFKDRGFKKVAILTPNDAIGQTVGKAYREAVERAGLVAVSESYTPTDIDLTPPMQRIAETRPDALLFTAVLPNIGPLVLAARNRVGLEAPAFGDTSLTADLATVSPPEHQKNVFVATLKIMTYVPPERRTPAYSRFMNGLRKSGPIDYAILATAFCWDAVQGMALAYNQAGTTDPEKVKAAFENLRMPAPAERPFVGFRSLRFSPTDHFNSAVEHEDFTVFPLGPRVDGTFKP